MKIYIDLVLLLNFCYDFLLLLTVDMTLKRYMKIYRHIISSIIGSLSIIVLFLSFNNIILFMLKILVSIIMLLISFGYKNIKYFITNIVYLYMCSVILGGFLYLLDNEFSYKREGLLFIFNGINPNYVLLLIIAPIILLIYYKSIKKYQYYIKYKYNIKVVFKNNKELICNGFIDTGNKLKDPITKKYVVLISKKKLKPYINIRSPIFVPYKALNYSGIIECFSIKYLVINKKILENYLVGISNNEITDGDCLLNYKIMEDICLKD